jgi:histidyl-tRNA synthetase
MNYANKLGINKVVLIGEEEVEKKEVKIKDMVTGEQEIFAFDAI